MGTRAQIRIHSGEEEHDIYLYQHSDGNYTPDYAKHAIAKSESLLRGAEYLTRIVFSQLFLEYTNNKDKNYEKLEDTLGYGIGMHKHGDIRWLTDINVDDGHVGVLYFGDEVGGTKIVWEGSVKDFVKVPDQMPWKVEGVKYD